MELEKQLQEIIKNSMGNSIKQIEQELSLIRNEQEYQSNLQFVNSLNNLITSIIKIKESYKEKIIDKNTFYNTVDGMIKNIVSCARISQHERQSLKLSLYQIAGIEAPENEHNK